MKKSILLLIMCLLCINAYALSWQDLWRRPDQQAAVLLEQGKAEQAADLFKNPDWQGVANYRAGKYSQAADDFAKVTTANGSYNHGNALAYSGKYAEAIQSYEQSLKLDANNQDAKHNIDVMKKLLQQQQQSQQSNSQQQDNPEQNKQHSDAKQQQNQSPQSGSQQSKQQQQQSEQSSQARQQQQSSANKQQKPEQQHQQAKQDKRNTSPEHNATAQQQNIEQQANQRRVQQWLRRIPDNPGGLLRQKFLRDHERYQQDRAEGKKPW